MLGRDWWKNVVVLDELLQFRHTTVRQDVIPIGNRWCQRLPGYFDHSSELFLTRNHIDFGEFVTLVLKVARHRNTPRAAGFGVDGEVVRIFEHLIDRLTWFRLGNQ